MRNSTERRRRIAVVCIINGSNVQNIHNQLTHGVCVCVFVCVCVCVQVNLVKVFGILEWRSTCASLCLLIDWNELQLLSAVARYYTQRRIYILKSSARDDRLFHTRRQVSSSIVSDAPMTTGTHKEQEAEEGGGAGGKGQDAFLCRYSFFLSTRFVFIDYKRLLWPYTLTLLSAKTSYL